jgi:hypothetical protein
MKFVNVFNVLFRLVTGCMYLQEKTEMQKAYSTVTNYQDFSDQSHQPAAHWPRTDARKMAPFSRLEAYTRTL